ncbi:MAG TPA: STAS domain-containing protein [Terriglobia bacterium]|nr:STAS domain-containing protein [Terriglobia bacterium]
MQTSLRRSGNIVIVDVVGDIDLHNSPRLRKTLLQTLQEAQRVVVNLEQVRYIDSSGIASLVEGLKESQSLKSRFILFGLSKAAREVLRLTRLINVFEVYETEKQALDA